MDGNSFFSERIAAGWLLLLSGMVFTVGGLLFTGRAIWKWPAAGTPVYLRWERGFVIAALLIAVVGLVLLEKCWRLPVTASSRRQAWRSF